MRKWELFLLRIFVVKCLISVGDGFSDKFGIRNAEFGIIFVPYIHSENRISVGANSRSAPQDVLLQIKEPVFK